MSGDGRPIRAVSIEEAGSVVVLGRASSIAARIELMAYRTTFDATKRTGEIPINTSLFSRDEMGVALNAMKEAFKDGFCVSELIAVAFEGEALGELTVPPGKVGLATVSSVAIRGVLFKAGVPLDSRFCGLLQFKNGEPFRFVQLIMSAGCSRSPAEIFVAGKMTSVGDALKKGDGKVLAHFSEIPAACRSTAGNILKKLGDAGIGGLIVMGKANETVCEMPVGLNKVGLVLQSGLNPVSAALEAGIEATNCAMSGLIEYKRLRHFETYV